jgi:hypothetical protein
MVACDGGLKTERVVYQSSDKADAIKFYEWFVNETDDLLDGYENVEVGYYAKDGCWYDLRKINQEDRRAQFE